MDKPLETEKVLSYLDQRGESDTGDPSVVEGEESARILIVDDDRSMLEVLSGILSTMGFNVSVAGGPDEAIRLLVGERFDLVFTDLNMPGMDGWSLASLVKDRSPETPVVLVTGEMEEEVRGKLEMSCVDNALFKPFSFSEVIRTANDMLEKRWNIREADPPAPPLPV